MFVFIYFSFYHYKKISKNKCVKAFAGKLFDSFLYPQ